MTGPEEPAAEDFDAGFWESRYRDGLGASKHQPSPSLIDVASGLAPGRALDAGCGVGSDALWLASRGWQVTAVDVSSTALDEGRRAAGTAGPVLAERIRWVHGDLAQWEPDGAFDLVSSQYVHVPGPPEALLRRLASWVAPGGSLLVVGHDGGHGREHAHPVGAQLRPEHVLDVLNEDEWHVLVAEPRIHLLRRPNGCGTVELHDVVVHAQRRSSA